MSPYEVLGVSPYATPDEIEAAYHRRLRACHPDLHWGDGPDAVAQADLETRAVTAAMAQLRRGWDRGPRFAPPPRSGPAESSNSTWPPPNQHESWSNFGYTPDEEHDWFGNPLDRKVRADHVACPMCGTRYSDPYAYRYHLAVSHQIDDPAVGNIATPPDPTLQGKGVWLGWIPWPSFWFAVVLVLYWAVVIAVVPLTALRAAGIWIGVFGYLVLLRLAFKHRRAH